MILKQNYYLNNTPIKSLFQLCFLLLFTASIAQDNIENKSIISSFEKYSELPRELVYIHLNKSSYIKGENIGFCAYVLDKENKQLSTLTTNLYCIITDKDNNIIKKELLKVENGISNGVFSIDGLFTSGEYQFKAFTNWMQNFNEQNFFVQTFRVIDPDIETFVKPQEIGINIDAQFLPEGGHLVANVQNVVGVVLKDSLGFGIPFAEGQLFNSTNKIIATFKVNKLGIGRFSFTPNLNSTYFAKLSYRNKQFVFNLDSMKHRGIAISLNQNENNVSVSLKTNNETLPLIKNKKYKLIIHNGQALNVTDVIFNDELVVNKFFGNKNLFRGINIFTLFDEENNPLLERLYFNHIGVKFIESDNLTVNKELDSLVINLSYPKLDPNKFNNLSVSILPKGTISYLHHHNLASYTLLQPYVRGSIEDAQYYFTIIDRKKKYELDNLLLTQGWSSYDWNTIFNSPPNSYFAFENGVGFIANIAKPNSNKFVLYPFGGNGFDYFFISENDDSFQKAGLFPIANEKIRIAEINTDNILKSPRLYLQFYPSRIPNFNFKHNYLEIKPQIVSKGLRKESFLTSEIDKTQKLEEVLINAQVEQTRIEKIKIKTPFGSVDIFDDLKRGTHQTFTDYLKQHGYRVFDEQGNLTIMNSDSRSINLNVGPTIFLDGAEIVDLSILSNFDMEWVDYVVLNKHGVGEGIRGGGGVIKIFTLPLSKRLLTDNKIKNYNEYNIPLTFRASKKFYVPKYLFYHNSFFKRYGVIDWLPINKIGRNKNCTFKIFNTYSSSINLFIQGIANDGSYISEVKTINFL